MRRVLNNGLDTHLTKLEEVMTKHIKIANQDDNALEWMRQMSNERFRHLPVIDEEGKAIAVLSQGDFMSYTWPQLMMNVKENVKMTAMSNKQLFMIVGSIMVYTLGLSIILSL
jgi:CBS-domain-containing membrane protein